MALRSSSRPGMRDPAMDALRAQVVGAAHRMLSESDASPALSLELIAARAGVARAMLHTQFGSPAGVLSALLDELTARGALELQRAFAREEPASVLQEYVAILGAFWDAERPVMRRLRALAAFDAELARAFAQYDEHRREGLRRVVQRLVPVRGRGAARDGLAPADVLVALTAFETYDGLAGPERKITDVVPAVQSLVRAGLGLAG